MKGDMLVDEKKEKPPQAVREAFQNQNGFKKSPYRQ
jgi:hypothetical protein